MYSKLLPAFVLVFTTFLGKAQQNQGEAKPPVSVGIKAGLYFSRSTYSNFPGQKPKGDDAYYAGLEVVIPLSSKLSLSAEGLYAVSSMQSYQSTLLLNDELTHAFIPLLLKYRLGKVSVLAGPQAEILLSAKGLYREETPNDPDFDYYIRYGDIKERSYAKFSWSGVIGAEWVFKYRFGLEARYKFGLSNFKANNADAELVNLAGKVKANGFQTGLFFRFGKKPGK